MCDGWISRFCFWLMDVGLTDGDLPRGLCRDAGMSSFYCLLMTATDSARIVEYATRDQAQQAVNTLSNQNLMGRLVYVREVCTIDNLLGWTTKALVPMLIHLRLGPRIRTPIHRPSFSSRRLRRRPTPGRIRRWVWRRGRWLQWTSIWRWAPDLHQQCSCP